MSTTYTMPSTDPSPSCAAEPYGSNKYPLDIGPGCIMWLPKGYHPRQGSTLHEPPEGALNHPIVVLSVTITGLKDPIISFAILRSFTKNLQHNGPSNNNTVDLSKHGYRGRYLEILPYVPEEKETVKPPPPLTFEPRYNKKFRLQRTSFVDLNGVYSAQLADLHVYNPRWGMEASLLRLDKESFSYVWERIDGGACGVGKGTAWTWVPTRQLSSDFTKCARARDDALKASATATASVHSGIKRLMLLLLRLSCTIDSIFAAPSSQPGEFRHHLPLHCAGLAAALSTFEETTTTSDKTSAVTSTHALTYGLSAVAIAMVSRRLSVRPGVGTQKSRSVNLVCEEFMGYAVLLAGIIYAGFAAKQSVGTQGSPAQPATMSMTAWLRRPGSPDEKGWTRVTSSRRRR